MLDGYLDYALARPKVFDYVFSQHRTDARRFPRTALARALTVTPRAIVNGRHRPSL